MSQIVQVLQNVENNTSTSYCLFSGVTETIGAGDEAEQVSKDVAEVLAVNEVSSAVAATVLLGLAVEHIESLKLAASRQGDQRAVGALLAMISQPSGGVQ